MTEDIELVKDGVRIGTETYRIGDVIKAVDKYGNIQYEGRVEFGKYLDGEGYGTLFHLGFIVRGSWEQTLIDFLDDAESKGWKIIKEEKKFDIKEGGATKYYTLTRKSDGREFTCTQFYDANLDTSNEVVEAHDGKPVTKEEEEAVKKAVRKFLGGDSSG